VALSAGLRYPKRLAGVLGLSCYLPFPARLAVERSETNADVPIFLCHGAWDPVVPMTMGVEARDALRREGYPVEWREYPMQHEVCAAEILDIGRWLAARLA
jgi:phospholipase/carboxylesterase